MITIRSELLQFSAAQFTALAPLLWIFVGSILAILLSTVKWTNPKWLVVLISVISMGGAMEFSWAHLHQAPILLFNDMMVMDSYTYFFALLFSVAGIATVFSSIRYLDREILQYPEYYILILFSVFGMIMMAASLDLIVLFIALELMSLAIYVLVGFRRNDRRSNEAAMKYFILGSVASAVLLYGVALLYGAMGTTNIAEIAEIFKKPDALVSPLFVLGTALILFGFLFKIAAVPFHMWMPDVYEGAPTPITGLMTTGLKAAAFAAFIRVFITLGYGRELVGPLQNRMHDVLWVSAVATLLVGNFVALTQTNLKRMLAYSSIAHTGYLMMGILSGSMSELGFAPTLIYVGTYVMMNLGAFTVLTTLSTQADGGLNLHDLSGLARRYPGLAFALSVFLFSMAGLPPTSGFIAKYLVFYSAVQANEVVLAIIGVLCSAVAAYYYLRVIVYMYMRESSESPSGISTPILSKFVIAMMVVGVLFVGVNPSAFVEMAKKVFINF